MVGGETRTGARRGLLAACVAGIVCLLAPVTASAATTTFQPVADSRVSAAEPGANFGTSSRLVADSSPVVESYLRFDVHGLSGRVESARLRLKSASTTTSGVRLHPVGDNAWTERGITYANAPAKGPVVSRSGPFAAGDWATLNASSLVTGDDMVSVAVTTSSTSSKTFSSRQGAAPPELVVETEDPPPPPPTEDAVVAAAGDVACSPTDPSYNLGLGTSTKCRQKAVSDLMLGMDLDAVLPLGDLQYENGELTNFLASYDTSWGRLNQISHPVPGNHEYATPSASGYFDYFNGVGSATGRAGSRDRGYYSFDLARWHVVALNSNCWAVGGCGPGSPQEQWLRQDLAANPSSCTLAYWHHPLFSSDPRGGLPELAPLWRALQEAGTDVLLVGHHHVYERFARQDASGAPDPTGGIRQFVVGTGGKEMTSLGPIAANSAVRNSTSPGVLQLSLHAGSYDWAFTPVDSGGFTDSGSDVCEGAAPDTQPPSVPAGLTAALTPESAVELDWKASTDDDGVSEYVVLRDGVEIGRTRTAGYTDASVQPGTSYSYTVRAGDPRGNLSAASQAATISTPAPGELRFAPTDDAYVRADVPDGNFGARSSLQVDNAPAVKHFLVRFDVSGIGTRTVESAKLRLHAIDPSGAGGAFRAMADTGWSERSVTWNSAPAGADAPVASLGPVAAGNWYEVEVASLIAGDGPAALRVTTPSSDGADYSSKEAGAALAPELRIQTRDP